MVKKLSVAILSVLLSFQGTQTWSQEDPDYAIEIQQNTVCGFINSNNVKIRADHSTQSKTIATLKRGDGVRAMSSREGNWVQIAARVYGFPPINPCKDGCPTNTSMVVPRTSLNAGATNT